MKLPVHFSDKMKKLLSEDEYHAFTTSLDAPYHTGLRVNTLRTGVEDFLKITKLHLEPVPWTPDGFYTTRDAEPGKHPHYFAGLYYIQEPSAMLPVNLLDVRPGHRVLDLCAAPGGKSVQISAFLKGEGLLMTNDLSTDRVKALVKNIELCGVTNAIVTNESPDRLAAKLGGFFDRILVDAPCSGEGMFRKDPDAAKNYDDFKSDKCAVMQKDILEAAATMLAPEGKIVYSTCTFSPEENEVSISRFLESHPEFEVVETQRHSGIQAGKPEWADGNESLGNTLRVWPHHARGEGHFAAVLRKKDGHPDRTRPYVCRPDSNLMLGWQAFESKQLNIRLEGLFDSRDGHLHLIPEGTPDLAGLRLAKTGRYLGIMEKKGFEPAHSLILTLKAGDIVRTVNFSADDFEVLRYLKGETLMTEAADGLTAVLVDGSTLGWSKVSNGMIKNLYPKGWRKMS